MTAPTPDARGQTGALALTIALWLLLADAAVETFLSGAFLRWWVVAAVTAFLTVMGALFWRNRTTGIVWSRYATASLIGLLALLAATAWLPDGLTNGVAMLWQPTPVVLSAVSALAVAAAGLTLARVTFLPWWGRAALGLLSLYGVAAFAVGALGAEPYSTLFQGGSLWRRLPFWLQGAVLGALVAVPCSIASDAFQALKRHRIAERRSWRLQQTLALAMSIVMALSGLLAPSASGKSQALAGERELGAKAISIASDGTQREPRANQITQALEASYQDFVEALSGPPDTDPRKAEERANRLESFLSEVEAIGRQSRRDSFDVGAVAAAVGGDPIRLFQWVRDKTCFVPYRGLLRGETGVLMDRRGNSLDRAWLLYALLRSAGHQARLAHAELPAERAQELLAGARSTSHCEVPHDIPAAGMAGRLVEVLRGNHELERPPIEDRFEALLREQRRVVEDVLKRVAAQTAAIQAAVRAPLDSTASSPTDTLAVQDHWWVQWQRDSAWVDLDPMLHDQSPGNALIVATQSIQPDRPDELPEDLQHVVTIRVVAEQWRQGELREQQVLSQLLRPFELYGTHIVLSHQPLGWPPTLDFGHANRVTLFKQTALAQKEWLPVLSIGSHRIMQSSVTDAGEVNTSPHAPIVGSSMGELGRGIGGLLGGRNVGRPADRPRSVSQLSAVWIDYEIRSPGSPVRKVRRQLFDLIGPAARSVATTQAPTVTDEQRLDRSLHLLGTTEILPLSSQLSSEFVDHLIASSVLKNREVLLDVLRHGETLDASGLTDRVQKLTPLPGRLYSLALARNIWSPVRDQVYLDHPNIFSFHTLPGLNDRREPVVRQGFDIVENGVGVNRGVPNAFTVRLAQGVMDTNAEAILVSGCGHRETGRGCAPTENVSEVFASRHDLSWLVVRGAMDTEWRSADLSADIRRRVEQDLAAGYVVVAPRKSIESGSDVGVAWWKVHPETGQVLGSGRFGWGQSATENLMVLGGTIAFVCVLTKVVSEVADNWNVPPHELPPPRGPWPDVIICGLAGAATIWYVPVATVSLGTWIFAIISGIVLGRTTRQ